MHRVGARFIRLRLHGVGFRREDTHCVVVANLDGTATNNLNSCEILIKNTHRIFIQKHIGFAVTYLVRWRDIESSQNVSIELRMSTIPGSCEGPGPKLLIRMLADIKSGLADSGTG